LSRYDVIGLIWLLHGRPVVARTADRAAIGTRGSGVTFTEWQLKTTERHGESFESRRLAASRISWRGGLRSLRAA
jgi:hypothetical protein